jgi:hypothetical protein
MNQPNDNQGQPTHEAQRVVIPFDIDMSLVERKVEELERRIKAFSVTERSAASTTIQAAPTVNAARGTTDQERQMFIITLQQMQQTLRDIKDLVELIYTDSINNG